MYKNDSSQLLFGKGSSGYPINVVLEGIGYVIAGNVGELKGRRVKGKLLDLLENNKSEYSNVVIEIPDLMTPLKIKSGDYCALVGAKNPEVYKKVVLVDKENPLKVTIRPITEEDFNV